MQTQELTSDPPSRRTGMLLAAAYAIIPYVLYPPAADLAAWPRLVVLGLVLALGLLLAFGRAGELFAAPSRPVLGALGLYIAWGAAGLFTAHDRFFVGYDTARMLVFAGWLMLLAWNLGRDERFLPRILRVLSVVTIIQSVVGLGQVKMGWFMSIPPSAYPPYGFSASSNYFGENMLMLSVLCGGSALLNRGAWRWLGVAGVILGITAALLTHADAVKLSLAAVLLVGAFCGWALLLRGRGGARLPVLLRAEFRWGLLALLLLGSAGAGYVLRKEKFATASIETVRMLNDSEAERIVVWKESLHMVREHPLWGVGAGNWKYHVLERGIVSSFQGFGTRYFMRGHNDFLQAFAERGIVGGLAFLLLWLLGMGLGIRRLERAASRAEAIRAALGVCGLMAWAVIASVDFPMERTEECLLWLLFLALATSPGRSKPKDKAASGSIVGKTGLALLVILALGFSGLSALMVQADQHGRNLVLEKGRQNWYGVYREAKAAQHWYYPAESVANTPIEWFMGTASLLQGDVAGAFPNLKLAYEKNPWHPHVASNYAAALFSTGKEAESIAILEDLLALYPEFHEVRVNLNEVYLNNNEMDKVEKNLTFWENHAKPRDISLYLEQVKTKMKSHSADTLSNFE